MLFLVVISFVIFIAEERPFIGLLSLHGELGIVSGIRSQKLLSRPRPPPGLDTVEFMFSANLGEPLKPLAKIISGGEISRFMLAVRTQTAKAQNISTFIFDEIDSGISGVIASVVAKKFAKIALDKQIDQIPVAPYFLQIQFQPFMPGRNVNMIMLQP